MASVMIIHNYDRIFDDVVATVGILNKETINVKGCIDFPSRHH